MGRKRAVVTRKSDQVTIRLPEGMRDELNRVALENGRSANAEIVYRLQRSLSPEDTPEVSVLKEHIDRELAKAVSAILDRQ